MTYTKKQCKEDMILLWGELARSSESNKLRAARNISLKFKKAIKKMGCQCPCCEYDTLRICLSKRREEDCTFCPAGGKGEANSCLDGDFIAWVDAETPNERRYYANKILIKAHMIRVREGEDEIHC